MCFTCTLVVPGSWRHCFLPAWTGSHACRPWCFWCGALVEGASRFVCVEQCVEGEEGQGVPSARALLPPPISCFSIRKAKYKTLERDLYLKNVISIHRYRLWSRKLIIR
jgi:hypothetical protein